MTTQTPAISYEAALRIAPQLSPPTRGRADGSYRAESHGRMHRLITDHYPSGAIYRARLETLDGSLVQCYREGHDSHTPQRLLPVAAEVYDWGWEAA